MVAQKSIKCLIKSSLIQFFDYSPHFSWGFSNCFYVLALISNGIFWKECYYVSTQSIRFLKMISGVFGDTECNKIIKFTGKQGEQSDDAKWSGFKVLHHTIPMPIVFV